MKTITHLKYHEGPERSEMVAGRLTWTWDTESESWSSLIYADPYSWRALEAILVAGVHALNNPSLVKVEILEGNGKSS